MIVNFAPLFTTARVIGSAYKIVLTSWLLYHLAKRIHGREIPRNGRQRFGGGNSSRHRIGQ